MKRSKKVLSKILAATLMLAAVIYASVGNLTTVKAEETTSYYTMNIPFGEFYGYLNNSNSLDAVSSATTQKAAGCSNVYKASTPTIENGTTIKGVTFPVKMTASAYNAIAASITDSTADYYATPIESGTPAVYMDVTVVNGKYSFSAVKSNVSGTTKNNVAASITETSTWGDYEVDLTASLGTGDTYEDARSGGTATATGILASKVYGAYFTTSDGAQYAMVQSANLWKPSDYYEFGWFVQDGSKDVHNAPQQAAYYASMQGKTISTITYITSDGIYTCNLANGLYVKPYSTMGAAASFTDANHIAVNLSSAYKDVKVNVTWSEGSGRTKTTHYTLTQGILTDGVCELDEAVAEGTVYTVTISSSNYAPVEFSLSYNPNYSITTEDTDYTVGGEGLTLRCTMPLANFQSVYVDGVLVDASNYTLKEGSTILTFKDSYLATLTSGDHTVTMNFVDDSGNALAYSTDITTFAPADTNVAEDGAQSGNQAPATGDTGLTFAVILLLAGLAMILTAAKRVRTR